MGKWVPKAIGGEHMGTLSVVLLGVFLILLGVFLAWPLTLSAGFVGVAGIVTGAVVLVENFLLPGYRRINK
jgi:uncharacterized membrane protein